ncbi:hypothetical protein UCRPC4_g03302 [Phaeomoniella chlamydospora]|uniref:Uncharacterized protein n=1 Tax=Phaeomoniella chlamydospora TaxID=158046 RepID=A0A0G2EIS6_PHACM|nr:hypothetical protein UCRPC4_g03302 [Phaeomoniella chlamydospora]
MKASSGPTEAVEDLETPTLKTSHYTTGRGGTGNMAKNDPDHPELAREAQDLSPPLAAELKKTGEYHTGRGGTANIYRPSQAEIEEAQEHNTLVKTRSRSKDAEMLRKQSGGFSLEKVKSVAEKGKNKILGK